MKKILLFMVMVVGLFAAAIAQKKPITGTVVDKEGKPVAGASVKVKGTTFGVATESDGTFKINVKTGDVLVVSAVNFASKQIKVGNQSSVAVVLESSEAVMGEVVVTTALGVKRQAKELGYATTSVSSTQLTQAAVVNPATGLAAKVSGVDIRLADNGINPSVKVTFRGSRSITGNNGALIVVDGVPVDQTFLANLNPSDIGDVTILKGSNAAALYGLGASNGVMVITTKKGKGKFSLNYSNTVSFESISYFPSLQNEYSGYGGESPGAQYNPTNGGTIYYVNPFSGLPNTVPFENESYGAPYSSLDFTQDSVPIGFTQNAAGTGIGQWIYGPYKADPNGRKDFFQTGVGDQNKLSASFANKIGGIFISGEHTSKQGVVPTETFNRSGGRFNGNLNLGRLTISGGVSYNSTYTNAVGNAYDQYRPVYWDVMNQQPNIDLKNFKNTSLFQNNQGFINAYFPNPWVQVNNSRSKRTTDQLISNLQLNYKLSGWLTATARGGFSRTSVDAPAYINAQNFPSWLAAGAGPWGQGDLAYFPGNQGYQYEDVKAHYADANGDLFFTATKEVNKFKFNWIVGVNARERTSYGDWYSNQINEGNFAGQNFVPAGYTKVTNADGSGASATYNYRRSDEAVYTDLTIGYDGWLFLHGSFRNDWTSILDKSDRSFSYPSVDLSAVLSDKIESIKNSSTISFLKLRVGYAGTGSVGIDGYQHLGSLGGTIAGGSGGGPYSVALPTYGAYTIYPTANVGNGFPFATGGNSYSQSYQAVQSGLKPEKTQSFETGFQLGVLKNKINLEATYYNQTSNNQELNLPTSAASGIGSYLTNAGKINNTGVEVDLSLNPLIRISDFRFDLGLNFSYQQSKVIDVKGGSADLDNISFGTTSLGGIYAVKGKSYPEILTTDFNRDVNGKVIVDPGSGLPSFNPNLVDAGNANYKYFFGTTPSLSYKHFTLRMVFDYRTGAKILNEAGNAMDFAGISTNDATNRQAFVIPNSVIGGSAKTAGTPNTNVAITSFANGFPLAILYWANFYNQIGMPYVTSAAFVKLREASLTYDIPKSALKNIKVFKALSFSLTGRNLFMWRPKTNIWSDPEFSTNATGNAVGYTTEYQTPPTRIISATLNATIF